MKNWTIVLFPKIQVDTAVSYFLLKHFGESKFPGISEASVEFWSEMPADKTPQVLEEDGYIVIDLGLGRFDHHRLGPENRKHSSSHLVAQHLEIDDRPDLQRVLELARRDDLEGRGTLSADPIDRAFGLSGLLTNLNKSIPDAPHKILEIIIPMLAGHYLEENRRYVQLPAEYRTLLAAGKIKEFTAPQLGHQVKVVYAESDNPALAGYIRSRAVGADLVIQRASTGHVNFITKQARRLYLHKLARIIKLLEAQKSGIVLNVDRENDLELPGRTEGLPHWYYDTRANTLQNGGVQPQGIPATKLSYQEIEQATKQGLNIERDMPIRPARPTHPRNRPSFSNDRTRDGKFDRGRGVEVL
ncbi:MAG: hypothetical protein A2722_02545 [Candidatus Doudnabacteria bacterium RIFCSPHIGHO2_01_FULL_50_11]|uniref:Uncharacterized protein n=1 Tax=Candidatus Doudnabacteria bacterium RIFCSPHIGHO2_01_FULL_50_11 TaxID=1817828 RepID=A0A1F5PLI4_9BACT|nr:MAG: hypothetical protein A2722_02545 [Candidatus Doudnabacteria bacterium RIFCSPHIGHO2_01_FULL_50_11]HLC45015.1 hypothetical protein [Patescibacteria group bacterium]